MGEKILEKSDESARWMLVTPSHIMEYHCIRYEPQKDIAKEHLIEHITKKVDHKHFSSDLKARIHVRS